MKKFNYYEIEELGYYSYIKLMFTELIEHDIKDRNYKDFVYYEEDPNTCFWADIVPHFKAVEFLKEKGLLNNGICPLCGERPIQNTFNFTNGFDERIQFNICKRCYKAGNRNSINPKNREGCYIATLCYGDYNAEEVITFRIFRDNHLSKFILGRIFIKLYYSLSPFLVRKLKNKEKITMFIRKHILNRIYNALNKKNNFQVLE